MKKLIWASGVTLLSGLVGFFGLANLLGIEGDDTIGRLVIGSTLWMATAVVITIWFLLTSVREFKTKTKVAYYIISAGILFYALTQIEQVVVSIIYASFPEFELDTAVRNLLFLTPYITSNVMLFLGISKLAHRLGTRTKWTSWILACVVGLLIAAGSLLLPRTLTEDVSTETTITIVFAVMSFGGGVTLCATFAAMRIRNSISVTYKTAMRWLALSVGLLTVATFQEVAVKATDLANTLYAEYAVDLLPFLVAGHCFMIAGIAFKQATFKVLPSNATYIDAVVYTAQLVSNPSDIDNILDNLRVITSRLDPKAKLTDAEKKELVKTYFHIEEYIVVKEQLRNITRENLRARLTPEFQEELAGYEKSYGSSAKISVAA